MTTPLQSIVNAALSQAKFASAQDATAEAPDFLDEALGLGQEQEGVAAPTKKKEEIKTSSESILDDADYAMRLADALEHAAGVVVKLSEVAEDPAPSQNPGGMSVTQPGHRREEAPHPPAPSSVKPSLAGKAVAPLDSEESPNQIANSRHDPVHKLGDPNAKTASAILLRSKIAAAQKLAASGHRDAAQQILASAENHLNDFHAGWPKMSVSNEFMRKHSVEKRAGIYDALARRENQFLEEELTSLKNDIEMGREVDRSSGMRGTIGGIGGAALGGALGMIPGLAANSPAGLVAGMGAGALFGGGLGAAHGVGMARAQRRLAGGEKLSADPSSPQAKITGGKGSPFLSTDTPSAKAMRDNSGMISMTKSQARDASQREAASFLREKAKKDPAATMNLGTTTGLKLSSLQKTSVSDKFLAKKLMDAAKSTGSVSSKIAPKAQEKFLANSLGSMPTGAARKEMFSQQADAVRARSKGRLSALKHLAGAPGRSAEFIRKHNL